jgi:U6 snRNA-associated Sm-like protein LSm1
VLLGEIARISCTSYFCGLWNLKLSRQDLDLEDDVPLRRLPWNVIDACRQQDIAAKKQHDDIKAQILFQQKGFCKEGGEGDSY